MKKSCCVRGCVSTDGTKGPKSKNLRFFRIPHVRARRGPKLRALEERRRLVWLQNLKLDLTVKDPRVCSRHFYSGELI